MIKLGKLTDYAIVVMGKLAQEGPEASRSAQYLSGKTGIPVSTVAKVLKALTKAQLAVSSRGTSGGYRLVKAPERISIGEIISALEGPLAIVTCVDGHEKKCGTQAGCPVKSSWDRVNEAIRVTLEGISLAEMIVPRTPVVKFIRDTCSVKDENVNCA